MPSLSFEGRFFYFCAIMKRLFYLLSIALIALVSCNGTGDKDDSVSLDGRWNAARHADQPSDYAVSLIFKGNQLDAYIIAWGHHFVGTYTIVDNVINYNITKAYVALKNVSFDEKGKLQSYEWLAGDMNQETFALNPGYDWYEESVVGSEMVNGKDILSKFTFEVDGDTATSDLFGMGLVFRKAK